MFELDDAGQLVGVRAEETTTVTATTFPRSVSKVSVELELQRGTAPRPMAAASAPFVRVRADEMYNPLAKRAAIAARAGDYTYERAMQELDALGKALGDADPNKDARARLFSALRGVFAVDDGAVTKALELLRSGSPHSQALLEALRGSQNARAAAGLVELLGAKPADPATEAALVRSLSLLQRPEPGATQALVDRLDDPRLGTQAAYGVGAHARSALGLGNTARAHELVELLLSRLRASTQGDAQQRYLRALGNASNPEVTMALGPYLSSPHASIRRAALQALTNVRSEDARRILRASLHDAAPNVRAEAAHVAGNQEYAPDLVNVLADVAKSDPQLDPRYSAVQSLGKFVHQSPEAKEALESIAANDASEPHRTLAKRLLDSGDAASAP